MHHNSTTISEYIKIWYCKVIMSTNVFQVSLKVCDDDYEGSQRLRFCLFTGIIKVYALHTWMLVLDRSAVWILHQLAAPGKYTTHIFAQPECQLTPLEMIKYFAGRKSDDLYFLTETRRTRARRGGDSKNQFYPPWAVRAGVILIYSDLRRKI